MKESKLKDLTKEQLEKYRADRLSFKEIAKKLNVGTSTVMRKAKELSVSTTRIEDLKKDKYYDMNIFDSINTEEKAYWLGFIFADGYVRYDDKIGTYSLEIELSSIDYNHITKFKKFLKDTRDDSVIKTRYRLVKGIKHEMSRYRIFGKHIVSKLQSYGCISGKSTLLVFPNKSIFSSSNFITDFIRGYIDGNGCLYSNNTRLTITIYSTLKFLTEIKNIFPEFGKISTNRNIFEVNCWGDKADQVAMKLYGHATVYLDRKFKKFATLCRLYNASEKSNNIGEGCDANTEITSEIAKGPEVL